MKKLLFLVVLQSGLGSLPATAQVLNKVKDLKGRIIQRPAADLPPTSPDDAPAASETDAESESANDSGTPLYDRDSPVKTNSKYAFDMVLKQETQGMSMGRTMPGGPVLIRQYFSSTAPVSAFYLTSTDSANASHKYTLSITDYQNRTLITASELVDKKMGRMVFGDKETIDLSKLPTPGANEQASTQRYTRTGNTRPILGISCAEYVAGPYVVSSDNPSLKAVSKIWLPRGMGGFFPGITSFKNDKQAAPLIKAYEESTGLDFVGLLFPIEMTIEYSNGDRSVTTAKSLDKAPHVVDIEKLARRVQATEPR